jgi:DNA (cytosine-5)-methyltransferase 1
MTSVYYNEIDPYCAQWLRNLMDAGHIPAGDIDTRSIEDVRPDELRGYTQCHFFAGIGGWAHALALAGWGARPVWTGSCPCQPFSTAGKRAGFDDERHLWPAWFHLIAQCRPPVIFGEQVASAIGHGWLDGAFADLEGQGYACGAAVLSASAVDAPHRRDRLWIVADAVRHFESRQESRVGQDRRMGREQQLLPWEAGWQRALTRFRALDNGIPRCVAATDAARNAIVPQVAAEFIGAYVEAGVPMAR